MSLPVIDGRRCPDVARDLEEKQLRLGGGTTLAETGVRRAIAYGNVADAQRELISPLLARLKRRGKRRAAGRGPPRFESDVTFHKRVLFLRTGRRCVGASGMRRRASPLDDVDSADSCQHC